MNLVYFLYRHTQQIHSHNLLENSQSETLENRDKNVHTHKRVYKESLQAWVGLGWWGHKGGDLRLNTKKINKTTVSGVCTHSFSSVAVRCIISGKGDENGGERWPMAEEKMFEDGNWERWEETPTPRHPDRCKKVHGTRQSCPLESTQINTLRAFNDIHCA